MRQYKSKTYYVCDKITMSVVCICETLDDVQEWFPNISRNALHCCANNMSVSKGRYVLRNKSNYDINESFDGKKYRPVKAKINGNYYAWWDIDALCERIGITKERLRISINQGRRLRCGILFEYAR